MVYCIMNRQLAYIKVSKHFLLRQAPASIRAQLEVGTKRKAEIYRLRHLSGHSPKGYDKAQPMCYSINVANCFRHPTAAGLSCVRLSPLLNRTYDKEHLLT